MKFLCFDINKYSTNFILLLQYFIKYFQPRTKSKPPELVSVTNKTFSKSPKVLSVGIFPVKQCSIYPRSLFVQTDGRKA